MLSVERVSKIFNPKRSNAVVALSDVSLQIKQGEFVTIIGTNGSGKSTLLNLIAGSLFPSSGRIIWNNQEITRMPEHQRSRWLTRVFQNPLAGTAPDLSILDNFRLAAMRSRSKKLIIGTNAAFQQKVGDQVSALGLGLEHKLHQPIGMLSGGQRQALTLLMSVMDGSEMILLDEPSAALDPRSAQRVLQLAGEIIAQHQLTALLITHNIKDALQYGTRLIQMGEGRILRDVSPEEKKRLQPETVFNWFN